MMKVRFTLLAVGLLALGGGLSSQEKAKKDDPKPAAKDEKAKGYLPPYWKDIVTEQQKQKVYQIQARYKDEIEKLEEKIRELKAKREKELLDVLTPDQKRQLEAKIKEKAGLGKDQ
jgi:hypothetical protein